MTATIGGVAIFTNGYAVRRFDAATARPDLVGLALLAAGAVVVALVPPHRRLAGE